MKFRMIKSVRDHYEVMEKAKLMLTINPTIIILMVGRQVRLSQFVR
jgi:hypothetical protein